MIQKIIELIKSPLKIFAFLNNRRILVLSDKKYLSIRYYEIFHKKLDLEKPEGFNEKLQWLKLYNRNPEYTKMVDKYEVKKYIEKIWGKEYVIPTIGVYEKFEDIDFEKLPEKFVMKCTHDSGSTIICKDKSKFDIKKAKKNIDKKLRNNFFIIGREWPYKNVKPRIIIEKYLEFAKEEAVDYKFFCFNGIAKIILVCSNRSKKLKETWFDIKWNMLDLREGNCDIDRKLKKPVNLKLMIELAEKLAKDIPFVRVDFYENNNKVYFGEITFFPKSGFEEFKPAIANEKLGNLIDISMIERKENL